MGTWVIVIKVKAEERGVTFPLGILPVEISHKHLLVPEVWRVQFAIGVFLEHLEICRVELIPIIGIIPEEANAKVGVAENKTSEIAHERLDAGSDRGRVEIGAF